MLAQEIVSGVDVELVDELDFFASSSGGVRIVPHLGFQVVADIDGHTCRLLSAGWDGDKLTAVDVVVVCLFSSCGVRVMERPVSVGPRIEVRDVTY